jgi:hypothetical protein
MNMIFRGRKGGGSSGSTPVRTPDTLRSADTIDLILGLGEGPWKGLVDGAKSFFVGSTALENASGETNFDDFILRWYPGASPSEIITPTTGGLASSNTVNVQLEKDIAVTRTGKVKNINYLEIRLLFSQLFNQDSSGDVREDVANFTLEYKPSSSPTWTRLSGASTTALHDVRSTTKNLTAAASENDDHVFVSSVTSLDTEQYCEIKWSETYIDDKGRVKTNHFSVRKRITAINAGTGRVDIAGTLGQNVPDTATLNVYRTEMRVNSVANFAAGKKVDVTWGSNTRTLTIKSINTQLNLLTFTADPGINIDEGAVVQASLQVRGKTTSQYVWELRWPVPAVDDFYDIRLTKTHPPESGTSSNCTVSWESFQEVIVGSFNFPGEAAIHLTGKATSQFTSLPDFWGIYDTRLIKIPTNYDPVTRTYDGPWDGIFKIDYSNNPAWCLYDFVMNDEFGMNVFAPIVLDKWDCYEAGQWCDVMVPDGKGGLQPRYTFNIVISEARSAKELAQYIAGSFGAVYYDDGNGTAHVRVDRNDDPAVALFTQENVYDGKFSYSYTDIQTRVNEYTVSFINPDLDWNEDRRTVVDPDHQAIYGKIPDDFVAVGCTDVQEALRRTRYKLKTGTTEKAMVNFKVNRVGQFVTPFEVILIADVNMGYAESRRITEIVSPTQFKVRDAFFFEAGISYQLTFQIPDENYPATSDHPYKTVAVPVSSPPGLTKVIDVAEPLPAAVGVGFSFAINTSDGSITGLPKPFRVMGVSEVDGDADHIEISAIEVNRNKQEYADTAVDAGEVNYSVFGRMNTIPGPADCQFVETFDRFTTSFLLEVVPTLNRRTYRLYNGKYDVYSRRPGDADWTLRLLNSDNQIVNHPPGEHEFRITPHNLVGNVADINQVTSFFFTVGNPSDPPPDVPWVRFINADIVWGYGVKPIDFAGFDIRYRTDGLVKWEDATKAHVGLVAASPYPTVTMPQAANIILIKAVDWFGNESVNPAWVSRSTEGFELGNIVFSHDFKAAGWIGVLENATIVGDEVWADSAGAKMYQGGGANMYSETPDVTPLYGGSFLAMTYRSAVPVPYPGTMTFTQNIEGSGITFEYRQRSNVNVYGKPGGKFYDGDGFVYDQSGPWLPFVSNSRFEAGVWEFKVAINAGMTRGKIIDLAVTVDVPDIEEDLLGVNILAAGTRLPITEEYTEILVVRPTLREGGTAVTIKVVDYDPVLGPLVRPYNGAGVAVDAVGDFYIKGFLIS